MKKKIRIAIYSRKSKYSDKGDSTGNQIELALEYIRVHYPESEYEVEIEIFEDEGFSGGTIDRPEFQKMLKREREYSFDILIAYRLDRISRNIADFSNLMNELTKLHTHFVSIKEQFDTTTPMGRAMMYVASVFAQLEREVIAERIRDNMIELAKTGRWLGGQTPTGFDAERYELIDVYTKNNDNTLEKKRKKACKLVPNIEEGKTIQIIAKKYLELKSLTKLETYLINQNILSRTGVYFSTSRLRAILTNFVYAIYDQDMKEYLERKKIHVFADEGRESADGKYGLISYNKIDGDKHQREMSNWIIAVGLHPGYIKGLDFIKIQELIEKNFSKRYRANCKNEALFSGLIRCKKCGSYMRPKATGKQSDNGQKRYYYTCELKDRSRGEKCDGANVAGIAVDNLIVEKLKEIFVPSGDVYKELKKMSIATSDYDSKYEIENIKNQYNKNNEAIKKLISKLKFMDIEVTPLINDELKKLNRENQVLEQKIEKITKEQSSNKIQKSLEIKSSELVLDIIENCLYNFDKLDLKMKKDILKILIKDIYGNGDKVEVNILNTEIDETTKKLFSNNIIGSNLKNQFDVANRIGEQLQQLL